MLADFIAARFCDAKLKKIIAGVIGTDNPKKIAEKVETLITTHCHAEVSQLLFLEASIGIVFGLSLVSGERIIFKIYNSHISRDYLNQMNEIQDIFYQEKFPAPAVLSPIMPFYKTYAGIYAYLSGTRENGHDPVIREELAKYLAKFSAITERHHFPIIYTFMQVTDKRTLWPKSHNVLYDFKKSAHGAGWIAEKAIAAKKFLQTMPFKAQLAHTDWDVRNTIFQHKKLVGVFDWDALGTMPETEMLGRACAKFTADWSSTLKLTPTPDEARAFVKSYETFRKRQFTKQEYQAISASADYFIATIARFEHASDNPTFHPFQDLLREYGDKSFLFA